MAQTLIAMTPEELQQLVRTAVAEAMGRNLPAPPKTYLDKAEVAARYGVSRATVHNWVHREGCPHVLKGKVLRFELAAVEAWFRGREMRAVR